MSDVKTIYRGIIDEVVTNSRSEFVQEGIDEAVLDELRLLWEEKLQQSGVLAPIQTRTALPVAMPYGNAAPGSKFVQGYYSQMGSQASNLGRPSVVAPQGGYAPWQQSPAGQYRPPQSSQYWGAGQPVPAMSSALQASRGQYIQHAQPASVSMQQEVQQPYISQAPGQTSQHKSQPETLIAYLQQAAASGGLVDRQQPAAQSQQHVTPLTAGQLQGQARQMLQSMHQQQQHQASWNALQQNQQANSAASPNAGTAGQAHQGGQAVVQERAMHAHTGSYSGVDLAGQKRKAEMEQANERSKQQHYGNGGVIHQLDGGADAEGKDVKDSEDKEEDGSAEVVDNLSDVASSNEAEEEITHQCLSQFSKVQRTKNRWKCQLLAGVMNLNGRDHVFNQASGEFQF